MVIHSSHEPGAFQRFERTGWESKAAGYEQWLTDVVRQSAIHMLDAAKVERGVRVLDVATGTGILASFASARDATVVGIDFAKEFLSIARRRVPGAEFYEGDAQSLAFLDATFDAVVCGFSLMHFPSPAKALGEFLRVLKPGGHCAVSVWEKPTDTNGFGALLGSINAHGEANATLPHGPDFFQFGDENRMVEALREIGFCNNQAVKVEQIWELDRPLDMLTGVLEGTVRTASVLDAQSEAAVNMIERQLETELSKFRSSGDKCRVSMPAIVGSGMKQID